MTAVSAYVPSGNIRLAGQLYRPAGSGLFPAVVLCHGFPPDQPPAPGDPGYPPLAEHLAAAGFVVLTYTARGVGQSEGNYSLLGWVEDCKNAFFFTGCQPGVDATRIAVVGFSSGGCVALQAAAEDERIAGVATVAAPARYHSLERTGGDPQPLIERFRGIGHIRDADFPESPEEWARGYATVVAEDAIGRLGSRPTLIVQGMRDTTVDPDDALTLFRNAGAGRELYLIGGAKHIIRNDQGVMDVLRTWLQREFGGAV